MAGKTLPAPIRNAFRGLSSPFASWSLLLWAGLGALGALLGDPATMPARTLLLALPLWLVPFAVLAGAWREGRTTRWVAAGWGVGWCVAIFGAGFASESPGQMVLSEGQTIESYGLPVQGEVLPAHLGGQLRLVARGPEMLATLGVGRTRLGEAALTPGAAAEAELGPWGVRLGPASPGIAPTHAVVVATLRSGTGAPAHRRLGVGEVLPLGADGAVTVRRLSADFGKVLGAAAQLTVQWSKNGASFEETAWFYVDAPDLDTRLGRSPWSVRVEAVEASPTYVMSVRRRGPLGFILGGWALIGLALLGGVWLSGTEGRRR